MTDPKLVKIVTETANKIAAKQGYQLTYTEPQVSLILESLLLVNKAVANLEKKKGG